MKNFTLAILIIFATATVCTGSYVSVGRMPVGTHIEFNGATCPTGYISEDGSSLARTGTYAALFLAIGVRWGSVDGSHFNIPDRRGVFSRGDTSGMGGTMSAISSNNATVTGHGFNHSGVPVQLTGTTPSGLSNSTTYWEIYVDANTIAFAASQSDAMAGTKISISGATGSVIVQWQDPDSGSRFATSTGGATSGIGSSEADQFASHNHTIFTQNVGAGAPNSITANESNGNGTSNNPTSFAGGNETRSKNVYVLNCIQY